MIEGLRVSVPERAVLELLYDVGTHQGLEEARHLFEGLTNPRKDMLGRLLDPQYGTNRNQYKPLRRTL